MIGSKSEFRANFLNAAPTIAPLSGLTAVANSKKFLPKELHFSMYIHGGRDLKEGPIASLWRVSLSAI